MARMLSRLKVLAIAGIAEFGGFCSPIAESEEVSAVTGFANEQREGEVGLNIFGLSLHTNRSEGHNEINPGLGLRYVFWQPARRWALFTDASVYYDSDRHWAKYVGVGASYRVAESWWLGAAVTYAQSPSYNDGKPFFAIVPGVGYELRRFTVNAVLLPSERASSKIAGLAFFVTVPLNETR
jgi:hypothetical protein